MAGSADNVAVRDAGRGGGQRLLIFGGNVITKLGAGSATRSTTPCFNTVTALEAFPHSSPSKTMFVNRRSRLEVARLLVQRHWPMGARANNLHSIDIDLGPCVLAVEQGADRVAPPPNRCTSRQLLAVTGQEPA
jgi:hypothetical protein